MRKVYTDNGNRLRSALISAAVCPSVIFLCVLVSSWLTVTFDLSEEAVGIMSGLAVCAGCFCGGFAAGNVRRKHGIAVGFVFGGAVFIVLALISVFVMKSFSFGTAFGRFVMIAVCSAVGAVIGVNTKSFLS